MVSSCALAVGCSPAHSAAMVLGKRRSPRGHASPKPVGPQLRSKTQPRISEPHSPPRACAASRNFCSSFMGGCAAWMPRWKLCAPWKPAGSCSNVGSSCPYRASHSGERHTCRRSHWERAAECAPAAAAVAADGTGFYATWDRPCFRCDGRAATLAPACAGRPSPSPATRAASAARRSQ